MMNDLGTLVVWIEYLGRMLAVVVYCLRHVFTIQPALQRPQGALLLEHRRETTMCRGKVMQRQVPHLGEINDGQRDAMAICGWWSGDNFERHVGCVAR